MSAKQSLDLFEPLAPAEVELVLQLKAAVAPTVQKHPALQHFCNDWCYVRYLRARQWSLAKATKMLQATLQWRLEVQPHAITWSMVEAEAASGKNFVSPFPDRTGRPVVTMRPRNQNTGDEKAQVQFLIYCLEHASRLADAQRVGKMTWLVDFVGYSMRNAPSVRTSVDVLHVLQNHYPERLGCAVCFCAPSLFSMTWRAVSPFIDPVTKKKIDFVDKPKAAAAAAPKAAKSSWFGAAAPAAPPPPPPDAAVVVDGGEGAPGAWGSMEAHFALEHVEECMGGGFKGDLFDLDKYRARMMAEDVEVAAAITAIAMGGGAGLGEVSISSNMSELTSYAARQASA